MNKIFQEGFEQRQTVSIKFIIPLSFLLDTQRPLVQSQSDTITVATALDEISG
jgi:hypothetical protein